MDAQKSKRSLRVGGKTTSQLKSYFYRFNPICILRRVQCQNEFISFFLFFFFLTQKFLLQVATEASEGAMHHANNFFQL